MQNKTVDVIIPTFRPDRKFDILLQRLLSQNVRPRRIIVVNTGEEFWDEEHVRKVTGGKIPEVFHVRPEEFDHGGTRHLAIQRSDADVFVCMTQDAVPADKDLIGNLLGMLYSEDHVAAVCARQLPMPDCGIIERYTRQFNYPVKSRMKWEKDLKTMGIKTFFCSNVCAAYRRDIYDRMGGFLRRTIFNEDMIYAGYAIRAGYGIGYCAEARVIHSHNYGAAEQIHRNFDLAVSQADHPEVFGNISSEGEGIRLVKQTAAYLMRHGRAYLLPKLVLQSACKYTGYLLGKNYRKLPGGLVKKLTMNKNYWGNKS